ncbi:MAG: hypothetical protein GY943_10725 [Chloroflexi bacterium]|nr:hypothetical protein [Chloroflexota bacterium]
MNRMIKRFVILLLIMLLAACQPERGDLGTAVNPTQTIIMPTTQPPPQPGTGRNQYWDDYLDAQLTIHITEETLTIHTNAQQFSLADFPAYIAEINTGAQEKNIRWVLYLPDEINMEQAQVLFGQFAAADAGYLSVYAQSPYGEYPRRDIGLEVGAKGPIRVITATRENYPEELQLYVGDPFPTNYLVANVTAGEMDVILTPLLATTDRKHIRLQEMGNFKGMPASVYASVLTELQLLGVETVSFYGVYTE